MVLKTSMVNESFLVSILGYFRFRSVLTSLGQFLLVFQIFIGPDWCLVLG